MDGWRAAGQPEDNPAGRPLAHLALGCNYWVNVVMPGPEERRGTWTKCILGTETGAGRAFDPITIKVDSGE